jgi:hypothetical protein
MGHSGATGAVAILFVLASGCGSGGETLAGTSGTSGTSSGGSDAGAPKLVVVHGAPAAPTDEPQSDASAVDGYATAMASSGAILAAGTATGVYALAAKGNALLEIVGDEPDLPTETGAVRAMVAYHQGVLVAAEQGVFFTDGSALQLSLASAALAPLGITSMTARITPGDDGGADVTHLAVLAADGAYEIDDTTMAKWTVDGESGVPTAILAQSERVFLSFGARTYEIDKAAKKAHAVPFALGSVHEIACGSLACDEGSLVYFASDAGLVERAADGAYALYPLAAAGAPAVPVETFALDASRQRLYALAGGSVLRVQAGSIPAAVATVGPAAHARKMAVDAGGDAWIADGLAVHHLALGTPLSFVTDVRPILHEYCADCHAGGTQGAPVRDYESYDVAVARIDAILMRVSEGTMPPLTYGKKLPKEKIEILQAWALTKAP